MYILVTEYEFYNESQYFYKHFAAEPVMNRALALLLALSTAGAPIWAAQQPDSAREMAQQERAYRDAISGLETDQGAYGGGLSEQILSLGKILQGQGRHEEAVTLFKRGVHLARINDGLYSSQQIPLLQGQITSHIAQGQYSQADERQHYLYRVQTRSMDGSALRTDALMQQAQWQYNAYHMGLGGAGFVRLMSMWDLYRMALNDVINREGENSPGLLPPLQGMLQAQYLIAAYQPEEGYSGSDDLGERQQLHRFNAYRAQSYDKGSAVILAIYDVEQKQIMAQTEMQREQEQEQLALTDSARQQAPEAELTPEAQPGPKSEAESESEAEAEAEPEQKPHSLATSQALVMLGDWRLWHEEREPAWQAYREAMAELVEHDDAQVQVEQLFAEPVALPNLDGLRTLPPAVQPAEDNILLEFGVSKKGRVVDLERVDTNEVNQAKANRLMRKLRKTKFRPRFEGGEPVDTEKVVRAYGIE
jgi:hypothetical protein